MKKLFGFIVVCSVGMLMLASCAKRGCTDPMATNYNESAQLDDQSCKYQRGCTNCLATNYDSTAVSDDGSCEYANFKYAGTYAVIDSLILPSMEVDRDTYNLIVSRDTCGGYSIVIANYGNIKFSDNTAISVSASFDGDSIRVPNQKLVGSALQNEWDEVEVYATTGFFIGDSIVLPMHFTNRVATYYGGASGAQN